MLFKTDNGVVTVNQDFDLIIHQSQIIESNLKEYTIMAYGDIRAKMDEYTLTLGNTIITVPSEVIEDNEYRTFKYKVNDIFAKSSSLLQDHSNSENFFVGFTQGYFNTKVAYEDTKTVITGIVNGNQKLDAPDILYEFMCSSAFRDKNNPTKYYRQSDMKDDYISMSSREQVSQSGTTSAAVFEDPLTMTMINVTRKDSENRESTLEKYMKL